MWKARKGVNILMYILISSTGKGCETRITLTSTFTTGIGTGKGIRIESPPGCKLYFAAQALPDADYIKATKMTFLALPLCPLQCRVARVVDNINHWSIVDFFA